MDLENQSTYRAHLKKVMNPIIAYVLVTLSVTAALLVVLAYSKEGVGPMFFQNARNELIAAVSNIGGGISTKFKTGDTVTVTRKPSTTVLKTLGTAEGIFHYMPLSTTTNQASAEQGIQNSQFINGNATSTNSTTTIQNTSTTSIKTTSVITTTVTPPTVIRPNETQISNASSTPSRTIPVQVSTAPQLTTEPFGATGKIISGPFLLQYQWFWEVQFTNGVIGWVPESSLALVASAPTQAPLGTASTTSTTSPVTPVQPSPSTSFAEPTIIAAGCAVPTAPVNTFYVDATNGSDTTGDGSKNHPWASLQNVISTKVATNYYTTPYVSSSGAVNGATQPVNATAPVHAGDLIYVMNGNYGALYIRGVNSNFITIAAAPGQTPVATSIKVQAASKWVVQGFKVQELKNGTSAGIEVSLNSFSGPTKDIVINKNTVSSQDDVSSWSQADWQSKALARGINTDGGVAPQASGCTTISNNNIYNIASGLSVGMDHSLFQGNTINNFGDDALDYAASNIVISHNVITNNNDIGDGNHEDGMQGQIGRSPRYSNVTIDSNTVVRQTNPNVKFPTYLQGIDAFDSDWTNITVTNNVVITNIYHGISFSSVHGGLIANNTVLNDGSYSPGNTGYSTWILVGDRTHEGATTTDMTVKNNISTVLSISNANTTVTNNIVAEQMGIQIGGKTEYYSKAGTYGDGNILLPTLTSQLTSFDPKNYKFNVTPAAGTSLVGKGSANITTVTNI